MTLVSILVVCPLVLPARAVFLDLEVATDGLRVGAMVSGGQPWLFTAEHLPPVEQVVPRVPCPSGTTSAAAGDRSGNGGRVPPCSQTWTRASWTRWNSRAWHFLETVAGARQAVLHAQLSGPVEDRLECAHLHVRCVAALTDLPSLVRAIARQVLPLGATRDLIPDGEADWGAVEALPLPGSIWVALRLFMECLLERE